MAVAQHAQDDLLVAFEPVPAPVHHRLQSLLATSVLAGSAHKELEPAVEPLQQLPRCEMHKVSGSQLDRERHPVELFAQLERVALVFLSQPKLVGCRGGPLDEEREGASALERGNPMELFAVHAERFAARRENAGA